MWLFENPELFCLGLLMPDQGDSTNVRDVFSIVPIGTNPISKKFSSLPHALFWRPAEVVNPIALAVVCEDTDDGYMIWA